jgi:hypothetical protein
MLVSRVVIETIEVDDFDWPRRVAIFGAQGAWDEACQDPAFKGAARPPVVTIGHRTEA